MSEEEIDMSQIISEALDKINTKGKDPLFDEFNDRTEKLYKEYGLSSESRISREFTFAYNREVALYNCKRRMKKEGITDESLIFGSWEFGGIDVMLGSCNLNPGCSFDKINADYLEIFTHDHKRFKISADGDKIKIEKM